MASDAELKVIITAIDKFSKNLDAISAKLNTANRSAKKTATGVAGLNQKMTAFTRRAQGMVAGLVAVAVATQGLRRGIGATIGLAIDFEESFAGIRKTMDATESEFKALEKANRSLAKSLPISVNEINKIGELAGQFGIRGVKNIVLFEETIAGIGIATNLTAEEAATAMARIAAVTRSPISQIDNLASVVVALGNNFATTEGELLQFSQRLAGSASALGFTADQILAIGTAFTAVGVPAERGGTAVQKVLIAIQSAATGASDELDDFTTILGITDEQFKNLAKNDPATLFINFVEALAAAGDRGIPVLHSLELADQRLLASLLAAAGGGDILRRALALAADEVEQNIALEEEVAKRVETTASQVEIASNKWADLGISIGQAATPAINLGAKAAGKLAESLASLGQFSEIAKASLFAFAALLVGIVSPEIGNVILATVDWGKAFSQLPGPIQKATIAVATGVDTMVNAVLDGLDEIIDGINKFTSLLNKIKGVDIGQIGGIGFRSNIAGGLSGLVPSPVGLTRQELARLGDRQVEEVLAGRQTLPSFPGEVPSPDAKKGAAGAASKMVTLADALGDGIISLSEALELGISVQRAAELEIAHRADEIANSWFRVSVEMEKVIKLSSRRQEAFEAELKLMELQVDRLNALRDQRIELEALNRIVGEAGLTGSLSVFRNALVNIGEGFKTAEESITAFLSRLTAASVDAVRTRFDALFSRPTKEQASQQLELAELKARRSRLFSGGRSDAELAPLLAPLDREIAAIEASLGLRRAELDVLRAQSDVADQTLLTDRQLVSEGGKLIDALGGQTGLLLDLNAQLALEEVALSGTTRELGNFKAALAEATEILAGRAGTGTAGTLSASGLQINVNVEAGIPDIVRAVADETDKALRDASLAGALQSTGAFVP